MNTHQTFPQSLQPLTLDDFVDNGRFESDIIGEFDGPGTHLFIVLSDECNSLSPCVVEIDRHTHCVFFSRTQMSDIQRHLEIALRDSPLESEVGMRTIGVISQLAISAYYAFVTPID